MTISSYVHAGVSLGKLIPTKQCRDCNFIQHADTLREQILSRVNAQVDEVRRNADSQRNQIEQRSDALRASSIRNAETLRAELSAQNVLPTPESSSDDDTPISGGGDTVDRIGNGHLFFLSDIIK